MSESTKKIITGIIAVSYTHLDVYKRQIPCCDQIPESAADAGNFEKERGNPPGGSGSEGVEG